MVEMLSPGVYVTERDLSEYVPDSSTCIVGIVGEAKSGPVGVPTLVSSQKELINIFGTPTDGEYGIYSALEILTQATKLYYVRVLRSATFANAGIAGKDVILYTAKYTGTEYNGITIKQSFSESEKVDTSVPNTDVTLAPLSGTKAEGQTTSALTDTLDIKAINCESDYYDLVKVTLTGTGLKEHTSAGAGKAFWVGVAVPKGVSYLQFRGSISEIIDVDEDGKVTIKDESKWTETPDGITDDDKASFYYSVKKQGTDRGVLIVKAEDESLTVYTIDFSEVYRVGDIVPEKKPVEKIIEKNLTVEILDAEGEGLETISITSTENLKKCLDELEKKINRTSEYIRADKMDNGEFDAKTLKLEGAVDSGAYAHAGDPDVDKLTFSSKYMDSSLNGGTVTITEPDLYGYFNVIVNGRDGSNIESFNAVTLDINDERYFEKTINKASKRIICQLNDNVEGPVTGNTLELHGGDDGISGISSYDIIGEANGTGLHALDNPELLDIDVILAPGRTDPEVIKSALEICESRSDCMFVADTPFGLTAADAVDWTNGTGNYTDHKAFNSSFGAFYWPWVSYSDSYTKKNIWLPPSGFVVARYAYNDRVSNPWNAPAGLNRGRITSALGVEKSPTKGERDLLYGNRNIINPIANFQSEGLVIWGQKTMQRKPTALDRVNVRRLLNYLKKSVGNALRKFIFEANNSSTWTDVKTVVNPILAGVKNSGGVYEYKISMQPQADDLENNRMPLTIYIKPTKTAEFIPITINLLSYGASFSSNT